MELRVLVAIVVGFFIFCLVPAVVIVRLILRHRQRMAMIEKGIAPQPKTPQAHLKRGLILAFLGGGILVFFGISILTGFGHFGNEPIIILGGVIFLAIGLAELLYYRLTRPKAAPPTEKESPPSAGRRLVAPGDDDAEKKTPQIDADKDKNL